MEITDTENYVEKHVKESNVKKQLKKIFSENKKIINAFPINDQEKKILKKKILNSDPSMFFN